MARIAFVLGGVTYATKKAVIERCRDMLHGRTPLDADFLYDLLGLHTEAELKIGCGVASFAVRNDPMYGTKCFWLRRIDGSETEWSYTHCLTPRTHRAFVLKGMRVAVAAQVQDFKASAFAAGSVRCAVSGVGVTIDDSHVDHHPTSFLALAERWRADAGLEWDALPVNETEDGSVLTELADAGQRLAWQAFHREHAELRIVTVGINLSKARSDL